MCGSDRTRAATPGNLEVYTVNKSPQLVQCIITSMKERKYVPSEPEAPVIRLFYPSLLFLLTFKL